MTSATSVRISLSLGVHGWRVTSVRASLSLGAHGCRCRCLRLLVLKSPRSMRLALRHTSLMMWLNSPGRMRGNRHHVNTENNKLCRCNYIQPVDWCCRRTNSMYRRHERLSVMYSCSRWCHYVRNSRPEVDSHHFNVSFSLVKLSLITCYWVYWLRHKKNNNNRTKQNKVHQQPHNHSHPT